MAYEQIVFMQGDEADEVLKIYNKSTKKAFEYLKSWHYPGEHETREEPSAGASDTVIEKNGYLLTVNESLGYIGLEYEVED